MVFGKMNILTVYLAFWGLLIQVCNTKEALKECIVLRAIIVSNLNTGANY